MAMTLAKALVRLAKVADARSNNSILGTVLLRSVPQGLRATATDVETWLTVDLPYTGSHVAPVCVPLKAFRAACKGARSMPDVKTADGRVYIGRTVVSSTDMGDFPQSPATWTLYPAWAPIVGEIAAAAPFATRDECRAGLTGVYLDRDNGAVVATDGHRLGIGRVTSGGEAPAGWTDMPEQRTQIGRDCGILLGTLPDATAAGLSDDGSTFGVTGDGWTLYHRGDMDSIFPDWRQVIPSNLETRAQSNAALLLDACLQAKDVVGKTSNQSMVVNVNGSLDWRAVRWDGDCKMETSGTVPCRSNRPDGIEIGWNAEYMVAALRYVTGGTRKIDGPVDFGFADSLAPIAVAGKVANRAAVVMPVRIE